MRLAKWVLLVPLTVALAMNGVDCGGMVKPEQAMQCCETMHCHPQHHRGNDSQDCCKTTLQMHDALGQPASEPGVSFSPVTLNVVRAFVDSGVLKLSIIMLRGHSHDPPICGFTVVLPLRI